MSRTVAVSAHPLSRQYSDALEATLVVRPEYVVLSHLRRKPPSEILATVRRLGGCDCLLTLEDATSTVLLPVLEAAAVAFRPRSIAVVHPDLRREPVSRFSVVPSVAAVGAATVDGLVSRRRARRRLDELLETPRARAELMESNRVLYLNGNLWFGVKAGGSVGHIAGVVHGFVENGREVDVLAATATTAGPGISFHPLRAPRAFGFPPELNTYRIQDALAEDVARLARNRGSGLLYQRLSLATYAGAQAAHRLGLPYVVEYNGSEAWVQQHWGRGLRYPDIALDAERATLRHAHLVVTVSDVLRDELEERGVAPDRIVWYPNCVDPERFDPERFTPTDVEAIRREYGIRADAVVITFVGTFGQWHGVDVLATAIRRLVDRDQAWLERERIHFLLVGDGLRMPEVRQILEGCDEYCTLTGLVPQEEPPRMIAASDILVSPHVRNADGTRFFGSPTKLFEYMAMERPILASRLDQIGDVLTPSLDAARLPDGPPGDVDELAVLAEPGSVEELVAGLRFLVAEPEWRKALAERARLRVLDRYTWSHHVSAILDGLQRVADLEKALTG